MMNKKLFQHYSSALENLFFFFHSKSTEIRDSHPVQHFFFFFLHSLLCYLNVRQITSGELQHKESAQHLTYSMHFISFSEQIEFPF